MWPPMNRLPLLSPDSDGGGGSTSPKAPAKTPPKAKKASGAAATVANGKKGVETVKAEGGGTATAAPATQPKSGAAPATAPAKAAPAASEPASEGAVRSVCSSFVRFWGLNP